MAYIQKDLNMNLLLLLVGLMAVIGGLTVFYQTSFKEINTKYFTKVTELNQTYTTLTQNLDTLNQTKQALQLKELREGDLTSKYLTVTKQKTDLEAEKQELLTVKKNLQDQLEETTTKLTATKKELDTSNLRIKTLEETRDSLQAQVNQLKQKCPAQ